MKTNNRVFRALEFVFGAFVMFVLLDYFSVVKRLEAFIDPAAADQRLAEKIGSYCAVVSLETWGAQPVICEMFVKNNRSSPERIMARWRPCVADDFPRSPAFCLSDGLSDDAFFVEWMNILRKPQVRYEPNLKLL